MKLPGYCCFLLHFLPSILAEGQGPQNADWPCYGADAQRSHVTSQDLTFPLQAAWSYRTSQEPDPAWPQPGKELHRIDFDYCFEPIIANNLVLFGSSADNTVRALDIHSGKIRWRFVCDGPVRFAPAVFNGKCYVASDDGQLYCLDAAIGRLLWSFTGGTDRRLMVGNGRMISRYPLRSGVLVSDGVVYLTAGVWPSEGVSAYALEAASGKVLWCNDTCGLEYVPTAHTPSAAIGGVLPQGYLLAGSEVLLVPTGRSTPAGFDRATGRLIYCNVEVHRYWWHGGTRTTICGDYFFNPATLGTFPLSYNQPGEVDPAIFDGTHVYLLGTGKHASQVFLPTTYYHSNSCYHLLASGSKVFVLEPGQVRAITMEKPVDRSVRRTLWASKFDGGRGYTMLLAGHHLVIGGRNAVYAYDATNGQEVWKLDVAGQIRGSAAGAGRLVLSTDRGEIVCLASGSESPVKTVPIEEPASKMHAPLEPGEAGAWILQSLRQNGVQRGFALVSGLPDATLTAWLAGQTELRFIQLAESTQACDELRAWLLQETPYHGNRISVFNRSRFPDLPKDFANVVIAGESTDPAHVPYLLRSLHPYTGQMFLLGPEAAGRASSLDAAGVSSDRRSTSPSGLLVNAAPVPSDQLEAVPPFEMRWFGGPGPARMADRHITNSPRPKAANGRYFVIGTHQVMAVDAYNGVELWSVPIQDACVRDRELSPAKANKSSSAISMTVGADIVRLHLGDGVHADLDARDGNLLGCYAPQPIRNRFALRGPRSFPIPYPGGDDGVGQQPAAAAAGTVSLTPGADALEITLVAEDSTQDLLDRWDIYFDFRTPADRSGLYSRGAFHFTIYPETSYTSRDVTVFYKYFPRWVDRVPRPEGANTAVRAAEALPGAGSAHPSIFVEGRREEKQSVTILRLPWAGIESVAGHPSRSFAFAVDLTLYEPGGDSRRGRFFTGESASRLNYQWPVFDIDAETDGTLEPAEGNTRFQPVEKMAPLADHLPPDRDAAYPMFPDHRTHPLTGRPTKRILRPSFGCALPVSSGRAAFFRSGTLAFYDYEDDSGIRNIYGVRPGCLENSAILPAMGLVIYSERSSGCGCNYNLQTSFALAPTDRRRNEDWAIFYDQESPDPLRAMSLNLAAPGDRRDNSRELWLGFPRPWNSYRPSLVVPATLEVMEGFGSYRFNSDLRIVKGTDRPWIYGSGYRGIRKVAIRIRHSMDAVSAQVETAPTADGRLDEACWDQADLGQALKLQFNAPSAYYQEYWDGVRASEPTTDWSLLRHDNEKLYLAFFDTPTVSRKGQAAPWKKSVAGRDSKQIFGDHFYGALLTDDRRQQILLLVVSASGAKYDARSGNLASEDVDPTWDGEWDAGVLADEEGFRCEIALPWKTLSGLGLDVKTLQINLLGETNGAAYGIRSTVPFGPHGHSRCQNYIPLGFGQARQAPERLFQIQLHFAEPDPVAAGERVFDIQIQGKTVLKDFDVLREAGDRDVAVVRTFGGIQARDDIVLEFIPHQAPADSKNVPILCGIQVSERSETGPAPRSSDRP